jgi:hypothetical protein
MKKITLLFAALMSFSAAFGQVIFSENFDAGAIPATFTLFDEDAFPHDPQTAFVTAPWQISNRGAELDSFAISTSYNLYVGGASPGPSSDWMITPAIAVVPNAFFKWVGKAFDPTYRDGYNVIVATAPTLTAMAAGTVIYTTTGEPNAWTAHQVSLAAFAGQTVYIGIQNNSDDMFLLGIDDIAVQVITAPDALAEIAKVISTEYTTVPSFELGTNKIKLGVTVRNNGAAAVAIPVKVNLYQGAIVAYTANMTSASIAPGATGDVLFPDYTPVSGNYQAEFITQLAADGNAANDTTYSGVFAVSDGIFARDEAITGGVITGRFGISGTSTTVGKTMGQVFKLAAPARMDSIGFLFIPAGNGASAIGANINAVLYATNATGVPTTLLATTANYAIVAADTIDGKYLKLAVGRTLAAGTYYIGVNEPVGVNMGIRATDNIYTTGKQFYKTSTTAWTWPAVATFAKTLVLHAILSNCTIMPTIAAPAPIACFGGTTSATVTAATATTYAWSNNQTTATATGLMAGVYTVTVSNGPTCSNTATVTVAAAPSIVSGMTTTVAQTTVAPNGSATVVATGGVAPYTYMWNTMPAQTTAMASNLMAGTYAVTVTDARGCTRVADAVVANMVAVENVKGLTALSVSPNPTSGAFQMNVVLEKAQDLRIDLTNAQGQLVKTITKANVSNENFTFNELTNQAAGIYFAKLTIANDSSTVVRIVVVK